MEVLKEIKVMRKRKIRAPAASDFLTRGADKQKKKKKEKRGCPRGAAPELTGKKGHHLQAEVLHTAHIKMTAFSPQFKAFCAPRVHRNFEGTFCALHPVITIFHARGCTGFCSTPSTPGHGP